MGLKEKMMGKMMNQMSAEERKDMMKSMMEQFFAQTTDDEKREMAGDMMPKMMEMMGMKGGGTCGKDAASEQDSSFNPMDMCEKMMASIERSGDLAALSTPEIRNRFEEWVTQVQEEIMRMIAAGEENDMEETARKLKISRQSLIYFVARLAQQDKISILIKGRKSPQ